MVTLLMIEGAEQLSDLPEMNYLALELPWLQFSLLLGM